MHDPRLVHPFCGPRAMASNDPVRITSHIQLTARYLSVLKRPYPGARKISNPSISGGTFFADALTTAHRLSRQRRLSTWFQRRNLGIEPRVPSQAACITT